jgi:hypothetical protein
MAMDGVADESGAVFETVVFLEHFSDRPDLWQADKVTYPLDAVLLLCLLAVVAGMDAFDVARFETKKLGLLHRFRPFRYGTPSRGHLGEIFGTLDADRFQRYFVTEVASPTGTPEDVIALDGKTVPRSRHGKRGKAAIHMASAFATRQRLLFGQVTVAEKRTKAWSSRICSI